ncbi:RNA polymerase sigma factor [Bacillus carboniphilus]|uniref:RNA polymerase sigma factor n=1 Tax=Bacillus carboniphilus TaxID=86663 RepID=A0ABY9JTJ0_9BACI|nr:RNA polymerase sigma factor [Bacillus carboniphilus]WLR41745.1 RNA polymerase sigma factor [Bacillus carboniphilus]
MKNPSLVDDIVQDTCIKIYKYLQTHQMPDNIEAWVTTVAKNMATDHLRMVKRNIDLLEHMQEHCFEVNLQEYYRTPEANLLSKQTTSDIKEALDSFDQQTKVILLLRQQGYSYNDISQKINLPLNTIKTKIHRGRRQLVTHLKEKECY